MPRKYAIAEVRRNLAAIIDKLDDTDHIELTRRGEPVAVLLSMRAYRRLANPQTNFWTAYQAFKHTYLLSELDIQPDVFDGLRDRSADGRRHP